MKFKYLLDKIEGASFVEVPFRHIHINSFLSESDFAEIVSAPEIQMPPQGSDERLFDSLFDAGYKIIDFPGCITNKDAYVKWHREKRPDHGQNNTACEGFGVTVRLMQPKSPIIDELMEFLNSDQLRRVLAKKLAIDLDDVFYDCGIQKYLDGYEISPHPDIRKKALTYMVNVNPSADSEAFEHHTHYMRFRDPYKYVQSFWDGNLDADRCWVPWDWCETVKVQNENNSIVIFSPSNETLHAVKARYDHLPYQRTQLYGNLWYHTKSTNCNPGWESFVVGRGEQDQRLSLQSIVASVVPDPIKKAIKNRLQPSSSNVITDRLVGKQ